MSDINTIGTAGWWGSADDRLASISTSGWWTYQGALGAIALQWTSPRDSELYVELFVAVHLMGDSDSKDSYGRIATVRSDVGNYLYEHDYPSGIILATKARVIDKSGRLSPFSAVSKVTVE